ncbi:MAG TPA: glycosyltransferase [Actinomycetota bacterium]|nr:glycosyltransferase [Actinomycetota bacterium]
MSPNGVLLLYKALGRGGAEQLLLNSARYLDTTDFRYEVAYIFSQHEDFVSDLRDAGLPVHCLGGREQAAWMGRLRALVRQRKPKIVHTHSPYMAVGARLLLRRPRGPRLIHTEHNVWESYHPMTRRGNLLTFPLNDHVFAVSEHVRQSIRYPAALRFLPMPPLEALYHGLDLASMDGWERTDGIRESLGVPKHAPVIGTVANFKPQKGHRYLLEAAVRIRQSFPEARFVLVGFGPLEGALRRQARQLGLEDNVIFTGSRSDVPRLTASFDVFALPSIYEGLSIALVEALAVGTPAVVAKSGGVTEVVTHDVNGIVVPPRDSVALGNAIVSLLGDPPLQRRLVKAGRKRARDFDIKAAVQRIEEVYRGPSRRPESVTSAGSPS